MSFFQSGRKTQIEMPLGAERQDLLADIARRAGERKQQVQALLEEYARNKDETPATPASATPPIPAAPIPATPIEVSFRGVLEEVHPPVAARRWTTKSPEPPSAPEHIAALEARVRSLEAGQQTLVGIVEELVRFISKNQPR